MNSALKHVPGERYQFPLAVPIADVHAPAGAPIPVSPLARATGRDRARRVLNVLVAAAALVLLAPVMLCIAVLIKLTSPGPVFYMQTRVGIDRRWRQEPRADSRRVVDYGGKLFQIYKFRTMAPDPATTLQIWATPGDNRVTPLGRVLRRYRLDELPQLVNVLKGDMNIVGPRPEQPKIFVSLREQVEHYALRQHVLPGITGWAQINHHYDRCIDDVRTKVRFDLEYLRRRSVLEDLVILLRTVPAVVFKAGGW